MYTEAVMLAEVSRENWAELQVFLINDFYFGLHQHQAWEDERSFEVGKAQEHGRKDSAVKSGIRLQLNQSK